MIILKRKNLVATHEPKKRYKMWKKKKHWVCGAIFFLGTGAILSTDLLNVKADTIDGMNSTTVVENQEKNSTEELPSTIDSTADSTASTEKINNEIDTAKAANEINENTAKSVPVVDAKDINTESSDLQSEVISMKIDYVDEAGSLIKEDQTSGSLEANINYSVSIPEGYTLISNELPSTYSKNINVAKIIVKKNTELAKTAVQTTKALQVFDSNSDAQTNEVVDQNTSQSSTSYTDSTKSITIKYMDEASKTIIQTDSISGVVGEAINYSPNVPAGWEIVDTNVPSQFNDLDQDSTITLKKIEQATTNVASSQKPIISYKTINEDNHVEVTKDNFSNYFNLKGSATYDKLQGIVTLTKDKQNQAGNVTLKSKINVNQSFTLTGKINIGSKTQPNGADGISIDFHNGNTGALGEDGGSLGLAGLNGGFGWKADTYWNTRDDQHGNNYHFEADPEKFHNKRGSNTTFGGFIFNKGLVANTYDGNDAPAQAIDNPNGKFKDISINYDGATKMMTIVYDGKTWSKDISEWITSDELSFIIAASTGTFSNLQQFSIKSFDYYEAATINVKYTDKNQNEIATGSVEYPEGAYKSKTYKTEQKDIPGYVFEKMDKDSKEPEGILNDWGSNGDVVYVYAPLIDSTTESKEVTETIHYVDKAGNKLADDHTDKVSFTRTVSKNGATGEIIYGDWVADNSDNQFDLVKSPEVKGYKPDKSDVASQVVTPDTKNIEVTVTYEPIIDKTSESKEVTETIHYVDKAGKKLADDHTDKVSFTRTVSKNGATGEIIYGDWVADNSDNQFDLVKSPEVKGYKPDKSEVASQVVTPDTKNIEVTVTYEPIIDKTSESKEVTETIHYVDKAGKKLADDHIDNVRFTRDVFTNEVNGEVIHGDWVVENNDNQFDLVKSPEIEKYNKPDKSDVASQVVTPDTKNIEVTVTYEPIIDKTSESKEVTETIHYVDKAGKKLADDHIDNVRFTRDVFTNEVNGEVTHGDWVADKNDNQFDLVKSPEVEKYNKPDKSDVASQVVTPDTKNIEVTVTYEPIIDKTSESKEVTETIHYVDKAGKKVADDHTDKVSFTRTVSKNEVTGEIAYGDWKAENNDSQFDLVKNPEIKGYRPDSPAVGKQTVTSETKDMEFKVTYTPLIHSNTESKEVTETIHYVDKAGNKLADDHTDKVSFTRTVSKNEVTGEIAYGDWKAENNDSQFDLVKNPELKGYRPDSSEVGKQTITPETKDMEFKVTYTPLIHSNTESKEVTETIHYVDKAGNKLADDHTDKVSFTRTVSKNEVTGEIAYGDWKAENNDSQFDLVKNPELKGYRPNSSEVGKQTITPETKDMEFKVTYTPLIHSNTESKEVTETIHYVDKAGNKLADDHTDKVRYTRTVSKNEVTGEIAYGDWVAENNDSQFDRVESPKIKGYEPDKNEVGNQEVTAETGDIDIVITYYKIKNESPAGNEIPKISEPPVTKYQENINENDTINS
ncbi:mucin-binding protein [Enterococcus hailinensis]|uniref:mucin-binding protein n=1 Tax=Enterococcus hailinensis TaxID=3238988 RepID=UPI0038B3546D